MAHFSALFDANVLASVRLTDLSIRLARTGLFGIHWSNRIHDEWARAVARIHPQISRAQIERRRQQMDRAMPQALVTGFESLIGGLSLPDADDRHVLAAAIRCGADVIVTFDLKHFPEGTLNEFGIEVQHPDVFLSYQRTLDEARFLQIVKEARTALNNPPLSADDYVESLRRQGLLTISSELEKAKPLI